MEYTTAGAAEEEEVAAEQEDFEVDTTLIPRHGATLPVPVYPCACSSTSSAMAWWRNTMEIFFRR
jgi:hypothetical protein